jgi:hypothetical protein
MSIVSFHLVDKWNKEEGILEIDAEVTVNGEQYTGEKGRERAIDPTLYWAKVIQRNENHIYMVVNAEGKQRRVIRYKLCHRLRHIVCCGHVSDDKRHDCFAMQHFTEKEF